VDNFVEKTRAPAENPHGNWTHPEIGDPARKIAALKIKYLGRRRMGTGKSFPRLESGQGQPCFCE
jgi:hypothetical protein